MRETMAIAGTIEDMTIAWLFQGLQSLKKNVGTFIFARGLVVKKVYIVKGDIVFASTNQREDSLGAWLLRTETITQQQFEESSSVAKMSGKKQGAVLVELGYLSSKGLVDGVKFQVKQIILNLFKWQEGYYIFDEGPLPAYYDIIPLQMSVGNLIVEGLRNVLWDVERRSLPPLSSIIRPISDPSMLFQGADLDQNQRAVFTLIDGNRSIERICQESGLGAPATLKALYVLLALRMAETGNISGDEDNKFVREITAETVEAGSRGPGAPTFERLLTREALNAEYHNMAVQNYYDILGVGHRASEQEITRVYFSLSKRYHPNQHFQPELSEMKSKLVALSGRVKEAYETLVDPDSRSQYDVDLVSGALKSMYLAESHTATQRGFMETADDLFLAGMKKYSERDYWSAEVYFQRAASLDPGNARYMFHRGLALARLPQKGREAEEFFVRAVAIAPSNVEYRLELGNFYAKYGLKAKALLVYNDTLRKNPTSEKIKVALNNIAG